MHNEPHLNILIRTSGRPNYFKRLMQNIQMQSFKNIKLIISVDSVDSLKYVKQFSLNNSLIVCVPKLERTQKLTFPWNLYLNDLMDKVTEGWILFMDDDDQYAHQMIFKIIADSLPDEDSMLVWKMRFPDGRLVPDATHFGTTPFVRKQIGMPCFAFHSKHKNKVRFDGHRAGDLRFANNLLDLLKVEWLTITGVQLDNFGNAGNRIDLINND